LLFERINAMILVYKFFTHEERKYDERIKTKRKAYSKNEIGKE